MGINHAYNEYYKEFNSKTPTQSTIDSLYTDLVIRTNNYHQRYKTVMDTFVARHGSPRQEEFFRVYGYYAPIKFLVWADGLQYLTTSYCISENRTSITYKEYCEKWMVYPDYKVFMLEYLNRSTSKAYEAFSSAEMVGDPFIRKCGMRRAITPSPMLADLAELVELTFMTGHSGIINVAKYLSHIYKSAVNPAMRDAVAKLSPELERLMPGCQAPELVLTDIEGNRVTLDDFKGKYVYLDFWDFGCAPCIREFGVMPVLKESFADIVDKVEFVTVCASRPTVKEFDNFVKKYGMVDRNLMLDRNMSDRCYKQDVFPKYVLIDPEGRIAEFDTARPSEILRASKSGTKSLFDRTLRGE